jgi:hypothetical protein
VIYFPDSYNLGTAGSKSGSVFCDGINTLYTERYTRSAFFVPLHLRLSTTARQRYPSTHSLRSKHQLCIIPPCSTVKEREAEVLGHIFCAPDPRPALHLVVGITSTPLDTVYQDAQTIVVPRKRQGTFKGDILPEIGLSVVVKDRCRDDGEENLNQSIAAQLAGCLENGIKVQRAIPWMNRPTIIPWKRREGCVCIEVPGNNSNPRM